jgi:hypothetical protein
MAGTTTKPTDVTVGAFIAGVEPEERRADAAVLDAFFCRVTGWTGAMWGPSMVGYGSYAYRYESGHGGTAMATGFSPRKAELSIYVMPGYQDYGTILDRLGRHRTGKACLYVKRLSDIDMGVLEELVRAGLGDLGRMWPVSGS